MSIARPELNNETDIKISDWVARARKLVDHDALADYGEIKVADPAAVDALIQELVDDLHQRNATYSETKALPWWNKISTAKVRGVAHNLTDVVEVLWMMVGKCSRSYDPWVYFFLGKASRAVIRAGRQATTLPGLAKVRNADAEQPSVEAEPTEQAA